MEGYQWERGGGRIGEKVQGIRSVNGRYKIVGKVKNSMGNGESKEFICTSHGCELRWRNAGGRGAARQGSKEEEKKKGITVIV